MMYAKGIRKVFELPFKGLSVQEAMSYAWKRDIDCFSFNGDIWACANKEVAGNRYIKTPFTVQDFEV